MKFCKCGCGRSWDHDALPSRMRARRFHPECPNSAVAKNAARCKARLPPQPCGCGTCGLLFQPYRRRKYAPDCPIYEDRQRAQAREQYTRQQRLAAGLPAKAEPLKPRAPRLNNRHSKRCNTCEDLTWRRPAGGSCPECGGAHREEANDVMREVLYACMRSNSVA